MNLLKFENVVMVDGTAHITVSCPATLLPQVKSLLGNIFDLASYATSKTRVLSVDTSKVPRNDNLFPSIYADLKHIAESEPDYRECLRQLSTKWPDFSQGQLDIIVRSERKKVKLSNVC